MIKKLDGQLIEFKLELFGTMTGLLMEPTYQEAVTKDQDTVETVVLMEYIAMVKLKELVKDSIS